MNIYSTFCSRFLFDWKSPLGYFATVVLQCIAMAYAFTYLASMIIFAVGAALFFIGVTEDIQAMLKSINDDAKDNTNRLHIAKQLFRFVQLHSDSKQLSAFDVNFIQ